MMHATILAYMFSLVEMNRIIVPLRSDITAIQNMGYVQEFMANLLKAAFPHLNEWAADTLLKWFNGLHCHTCDQQWFYSFESGSWLA